MSRWIGFGLLLVIVGALALRLPQLDRRPMHNDEAVNARLIQKLWQDGLYKYNPDEYHGPALYYATMPFVRTSGAKDFNALKEGTLRLAPVFFGVLLILLLWLMADGLGSAATLIAGVLLALSPAMVFYSRYFIHEMLLICFTMVVMAGGWRYSQTRKIGWAVMAGLGLGLMYATKETFVFAAGAMVLAGMVARFWTQRSGTYVPEPFYWNIRHLLTGTGAAAFISVALFTSFFTDPAGPLNSIRSYMPWLERAGGQSPHIHPTWFYLERLLWFHQRKGPVWSEGAIVLLALSGAIAAITGKGLGKINPALARFLTIYTILMTMAYSAISYKTPWCMLGFLHGMILLAGIGATALFVWVKPWALRIALGVVLLLATAHLGWQAWRASYVFAADWRNPYVYAQTSDGIRKLVERVQGIAKVHPQGEQMLIKVMAANDDYWPLPYYLRNFKQIGYWGKLIEDPYAPVVIVSSSYEAALDEKSNKAWLSVGFYELRPKVFLEMYVQFDLWKKYIESQPRPAPEE